MPTYHVDFPDGHTQSFDGPEGMTDEAAYQRATQERSFAAGHIPTTFTGGALTALGKDQGTTTALMTGASLIPGLAPLAAGAPLMGRLIRYGTERATSDTPEPLTTANTAELAAAGLAQGYGPKLLSGGLRGLASKTVAHQLPSGQWVPGIKGSGFLPWAVRTGGEMGTAAATQIDKATPEGIRAMLLRSLGL